MGGTQAQEVPGLSLTSDGLSLGWFLFLLSQASSQGDCFSAGGEGAPEARTLRLAPSVDVLSPVNPPGQEMGASPVERASE